MSICSIYSSWLLFLREFTTVTDFFQLLVRSNVFPGKWRYHWQLFYCFILRAHCATIWIHFGSFILLMGAYAEVRKHHQAHRLAEYCSTVAHSLLIAKQTSYLNCGVRLTLCMSSMISMSSPLQACSLQPLQLNFTLDGFSFFMPFCFFFFASTLFSIIACIWYSMIWGKVHNVTEKSLTAMWVSVYPTTKRFWEDIPVCHTPLALMLWFSQLLCPSWSCGTHWQPPFQPPQSSSPQPESNCCPQPFLCLSPAKGRANDKQPLIINY